jgi:hypothetical protein
MFKKMSFSILGPSFGILLISFFAYGQTSPTGQTSTTTTTTIEQTTKTPPSTKKRVSKPAAKPVEQTTIQSTTTTTEVTPPPPQKEVVRKVYDEEALKKMTICVEGFKSYVGSNDKNVCRGKATPPDIAYTCKWDKKGPPAFSPTQQGPCSLDFTEHRGGIVIKKDNFPSGPPLSYGTQVECCFRAAKGLEPSASK